MQMLELMGLEEHAGDIAGSLPYGLQRRLEIARILAAKLANATGWEVLNAGLNGREIPHTPGQLADAVSSFAAAAPMDLAQSKKRSPHFVPVPFPRNSGNTQNSHRKHLPSSVWYSTGSARPMSTPFRLSSR